MGRRLYILVFGLIGSVFLLVGGYVGLVEGPAQDREARAIEALPTLAHDQLAAHPPGTHVALTGTLTDNGLQTNDEYGVTGLGLVAYEVREWDVRTDSDGDVSGLWTLRLRDIPPLVVQNEGGSVVVERADPAAEVELGGALYETITRDGDGVRSASYNGRSLREGAWRVQGFRNGDMITAVGTLSSDGITPDRLYAGTHADLVDELRDNARFLRLFGLIVGGLGALLDVVALVLLVRHLR